ncbi:MAG TPA: hypothetical protein VFG04_00740 [Planctomycetaceae bacterium]|jgi:hypothetical protein|nr:hypothetical protein [Planctomycetaceae bacterium]
MLSTVRRAPLSFLSLAFLFVAAGTLQGCYSRPSEQETVDAWFKNNPKLKKVAVAPVSGHVSIDGQPPAKGTRVYIIISDFEHPEMPDKEGPKQFTHCDAEGNFAFKTYVTGDGIPCGKYVATFVSFTSATRRNGKGGFGGVSPNRMRTYAGPDELKNLYSDPRKNKTDPNFVLDVQGPGRTDYDFSLAVAGKDPIPTPSEYAPKSLSD